jgi:hypothetical protein
MENKGQTKKQKAKPKNHWDIVLDSTSNPYPNQNQSINSVSANSNVVKVNFNNPAIGFCQHERSTASPIFTCCERAHPCRKCHDLEENHKASNLLKLCCKMCKAYNIIMSKECVNCKLTFTREKNGQPKNINKKVANIDDELYFNKALK